MLRPSHFLECDIDQHCFIKGASADQVRDALADLFKREGMVLVQEPEYPRGPAEHKALGHTIPRWAAVVMRGSDDWVLVKTSPRQLLAEKPVDFQATRLRMLCETLGASSFLLLATNYERQSGWVLMEVEPGEETLVSGYWLNDLHDNADDGRKFFGHALDTESSPWKITPRSKTLLALLDRMELDIHDRARYEDGPVNVMRDHLTPILMHRQSYEICRNSQDGGSQTFFFRRPA
jgi:hypothetical protein